MANKVTAEDRRTIVAKYIRGREDGAETEDWADPDLSIYKSTDRYGFLHKVPLPPYAIPEKIAQLERDRALKWSHMVRNWPRFEHTEKLQRRVNKGIPDSIRGEVWKHVLDLTNIRANDIYEPMLELGRLTSPDVAQIDIDVLRTFREHIMYRERYGIKQQALFNVLVAYSMYNPVLGYCQGMSNVAAVLLMYLNEEDAFWAMVVLIGSPKFAMHGMLIPGLPKLLAYFEYHKTMRKRLLPKIDKHLVAQHLEPVEYCTQWFVKCYLDTLPFQLVLRIWDAMMFKGEKVLIAMSLIILKLNKKSFLRKREEAIRLAMHELHKDSYNEDEVILELERMMADITKTRMEIPQSQVVLQELSTLNSEALHRAGTLGRHQQQRHEEAARSTSSTSAQVSRETSGLSQGGAGDGRELITQALERRNTYQAKSEARERASKTTPTTSQVGGVEDRRAHPQLQGHRSDQSDAAKKPRNFVVTPTQFNNVSRASSDARGGHSGRGHPGHSTGWSPTHGQVSISPQRTGVRYHHGRPPQFDNAGPRDSTLV